MDYRTKCSESSDGDDKSDIGEHTKEEEQEDEGPRGKQQCPSPVTFASTTTVATKIRTTAVKAHTAPISQTTAKVHKPFVPIDFESMRRGFLQGGVNTKTTNSAGSTFSVTMTVLKYHCHIVLIYYG